MRTVKIIGGLGNQLFQYALLIGLKESFQEDIYVDISGFKDYNLHNGLELESIFNIKLNVANGAPFLARKLTLSRYIKQYLSFLCGRCQFEYPDFRYIEDIYKDCNKNYYAGYWHHFKYVEPFRDKLLDEYTFPPFTNNENLEVAKTMMKEISVGLHVRRGDYLNEKQYQGICSLDYYKRAIEIISKRCGKVAYYVFSNDEQWCRENLSVLFGESKVTYVNWNKGKYSYCDMQLMTYCKGLVIANSSFSWWGAFLNQQENKFVIAPKRWKNAKYDLKIQMPEWTLI